MTCQQTKALLYQRVAKLLAYLRIFSWSVGVRRLVVRSAFPLVKDVV